MIRIIGVSLLLCALVGLSQTKATVESEEYTAAVVEYIPSNKEKLSDRIDANLNEYINFINEAGKKEVDIIVFPEATLTPGSSDRNLLKDELTEEVPDPRNKTVPCDKNVGHILKGISCAAKNNKIYVVINLSEMATCSTESLAEEKDDRKCAVDAKSFYNTNVVFDRDGAVIARYRKFNLFGQIGVFNTTKTAQRVTFDTDFGVRFGLFTCFDILFNEPTMGLVRDGVKDFIFPTMWFSELPFLTALQIQEYWAYKNDVNLLASGASNTTVGSGGSGIYAGKQGPLQRFISKPVETKSKDDGAGEDLPKPENNKLLIARVPKLKITVPKPKLLENPFRSVRDSISQEAVDMDKFFLKNDSSIEKFVSEEILVESFEKEICQDGLCCKFNVKSQFLNATKEKVHYTYRAVVGNVVRTFSGVTNGGIKSCAILACSGTELKKCSVRFPDSSKVEDRHIFQSIVIEGDFPNIDEVLTLPNTLSHKMIPLRTGSFNYKEDSDGDKKHVTISSRGLPVRDIHTFGIFGRDFRFDGNSSATIKSSFTIFFTIISYFFVKYVFNM